MPGDNYLFFSNRKCTHAQKKGLQIHTNISHTRTIMFPPSAQLSTTLRSNCLHLVRMAYFCLRPTCSFSLALSLSFTLISSSSLTRQFATNSHSYGTLTHAPVRHSRCVNGVDKRRLMRKKVLCFCNGGKKNLIIQIRLGFVAGKWAWQLFRRIKPWRRRDRC